MAWRRLIIGRMTPRLKRPPKGLKSPTSTPIGRGRSGEVPVPDMFFGEVRTRDSHSVAAGLTFSDGHLVLSSDTQRLGRWPVDQVSPDPVDSPTLRIPSATKGSSPVRGGV